MNSKYLQILKNKYFIATFLILVWMTFLDSNNFIHRINKTMKLNELKAEKAYYLKKMKDAKAARKELMKSSESLERFAREQYFMKRKNEDLFIVVREE